MGSEFHIVVCGSIVPDPLQTLAPQDGPAGPTLKNEMMLPAVLDPWAGHALYEAANLAAKNPGSQVWLVSLGPKAKLQQVMMSVAQKVPFQLVVADGSASGFVDSYETAKILADTIDGVAGLDKSKLLLFGGWQSASRGSGAVMQMVGELLGVTEQFQGVDRITVADDGSIEVLERVEGGAYQKSVVDGAPAAFGWATGELPEPPNNPQIGMQNMQKNMPALMQAKPADLSGSSLSFASVQVPQQRRETRIVKDMPVDDMAKEIVEWIKG
ncbi:MULTISPECIES: electron transfer flavoprotein subunit beta [unclassified Pseudodesulfovibrio]|uniref:electron transfer flavoprotein subunit beta/FixA family protein n=1 Tax=unclassified Pseudodesulfovibrio TaxID=2661612 RepID=UPI000FEBEE94|nr:MULTISPECIES: electron transfer flavoprotein subunit beta [unclassified Pseudodesulfovibrio]MCJ2165898.1 electron transfer flavoprotein subunit beta [Pseudodesulfovibrio sp. S3-i]RWU02669.1 electron transfer flavoprotein subunit beta [Pseudodesulfovibrio sp. S3]